MSKQRNWNEGSYIRGEIDLTEEDSSSEEFYFAWFQTQSNLKASDREEQERVAAIREQIADGVIQPNGLPVGYVPPQRKENKFERQVRRKKEREEQKRLKKLQRNGFPIRRM